MATSLIDQLAERLDLTPNDARQALTDLSSHVKEQLDDRGEASVPGLGVFRTGPEGLTFEPNQTLALSVNQRYAGLKPVTVGADPSASFRKQEVVAPPSAAAPEPPPEEPEAAEEPKTAGETEELTEAIEELEATEEPEAAEEPAEDDIDALLDEADGETWQPPEPAEEDHPLGPMPKPTYEEADFSVLADFEETRQVAEPEEHPPDDEPEDGAEVEPDDEETRAEAEASVGAAAADEDRDDLDLPDETDQVEDEDELSEVEAVRLPVAGAPRADFPEDEPDLAEADVTPAPAEPEEAPEDASPFFEEWTPSDFEGDDVEEETPTGATGDLEGSEEAEPPAEPEEEEEPAVAFAPPVVPPEPTAEPPTTRRPTRREREPQRSKLPWILGVTAVVVIAALLFWLYPFTPEDPVAEPPIAQQEPITQPPTPPETPSETGAEATEEPPPGDPAEPAPSAEATTPSTATSGASDDLTTIDRDAGVWTMVVASWTIRENAEQELEGYADQFRARGYPVDLLTETSGDVTRYRVAVGAFPNQNAAEQARQQLSEALPDGTWLLRVRPDM